MFLLENLDIKYSRLIDYLVSYRVVSVDEQEAIRAEVTPFRANEKLLSVLSRKSPQQFQLFLDALDECGQHHIRNEITDRRPGLSTLKHFWSTNLNFMINSRYQMKLIHVSEVVSDVWQIIV